MTEKKIQGWNPTYFGEPKKGSLAATIADITTKQNDLVGGKPEVMDSVAVQAQKEKEQTEALDDKDKETIKPIIKQLKKSVTAHDKQAKQLQKDIKDDAEDMRNKNKKDAKGEDKPVKVHGENLNKEIEKAQQDKIKSLVDTIKDMFYTPEEKEVKKGYHKMPDGTIMKDTEHKKEEEGNAFGKAVMAAKEKGEKEFVFSGKKYNVEAEMDKVNPVAVKKKFKDRKDKDIDNDGDVDDSDRFLHKRRKAISKAIDK